MMEQGKSLRSPPPEEEQAAETTCDELSTTPIPLPPGCVERCFKIWVYYSHYPRQSVAGLVALCFHAEIKYKEFPLKGYVKR